MGMGGVGVVVIVILLECMGEERGWRGWDGGWGSMYWWCVYSLC